MFRFSGKPATRRPEEAAAICRPATRPRAEAEVTSRQVIRLPVEAAVISRPVIPPQAEAAATSFWSPGRTKPCGCYPVSEVILVVYLRRSTRTHEPSRKFSVVVHTFV